MTHEHDLRLPHLQSCVVPEAQSWWAASTPVTGTGTGRPRCKCTLSLRNPLELKNAVAPPFLPDFPLQVQSGSQRSSQIFLLSLPVVRVVLQDLCRYYVVRSTTVLSAFWTCLGAT